MPKNEGECIPNESPTESIVTWPESMAGSSAVPLFHPDHSRALIGSACRTVASIPARYCRHMCRAAFWFAFFFRNCIGGNSMSRPHSSILHAPTAANQTDNIGPSPGIWLPPTQRLALRRLPATCIRRPHVRLQLQNGKAPKRRRAPPHVVLPSICHATSPRNRAGPTQPD